MSLVKSRKPQTTQAGVTLDRCVCGAPASVRSLGTRFFACCHNPACDIETGLFSTKAEAAASWNQGSRRELVAFAQRLAAFENKENLH